MDEELKDQEILIDGKEAKRQFLEEVRKNVENKKVREQKASEDDSLNVENKEIVDNDDESKSEASEDKEENNNPEVSETLEDNILEENEEENVDTALVSIENTERKGKSFFDGILKATLIDTAVTALASLLGVYIFDLLLRLLCGYYVVDFKGVYIILFLIILVLYPIIMQHSKQGKTLGQKIGKVEVKEREE